MTSRILALCLLALSVIPAAGAPAAQVVSFKADDGVNIAATLYTSGKAGPGVILLHMLSRTRDDWRQVGERLAEAGFVVLAIDLRGHGDSDKAPDEADLQELPKMQLDVKAARAFLAARPDVTQGRVGMAGASIGANLAILHAANDTTVRSLVLLSPGIDYRGLRPENALRKYDARPALLLVSQEDNYSTNSCRTLVKAGSGTRDLRILSGAGHGTTILERQPDLVGTLVDWFRRTLL